MFFHTKSVPEPRWSTSAVRRLQDGLVCGSSIVFCNSVSADRIGMFLLKIILKRASKSSFFALASRSGFGPAISDPVARSSTVFYNSVFADRIVMAASRLLLATAACVILLSFAAGLRKSYWSGCMKAATVICQQISSILALVIFLLKILLKSASKSSFFSLWRRDPVLDLQFPTQLRVVLLCFTTQSLQIA